MPAEHPLFILYTSGSTGKPKGVQHSTAGFLLHAINTCRLTFDLQDNDIYWCTADVGWITGHTYVAYGPTAMGSLVLLNTMTFSIDSQPPISIASSIADFKGILYPLRN